MKTPLVPLFLLIISLATSSRSETVKDREGAVRQDKATMENDARWIYNDFQRGFTEAKRTGKPLLVVLRCVPCLACGGLDASVLQEPELAPLLDQFVCVRVINANTLDLSLFQFDYDLSFSTMFFNGDGAIYGRYGSWTHQKNALDKTTAGFKRALEGALALHKGYPANQAALTGKRGDPLPFKTPLDMPTLAGKFKAELDWNGKVVQSCVHCHQIGDAMRVWYREQKKAIPTEWIFSWPAPETVGLSLAPDHAARIEAVVAGSPAAQSGLGVGDEIVSLGGQPPISIADVSWILHRAPESGALPTVVRRGGAEKSLTLALPVGWRQQAEIAKRVGTWGMRGMAIGGLVLEDLANAERTKRGMATNQLALLVKFVGQYGKHAAAKSAGFKKDDVIVEVDAKSGRMSEGQLMAYLLEKRRPGEKVQTAVLRGPDRVVFSLPMQ